MNGYLLPLLAGLVGVSVVIGIVIGWHANEILSPEKEGLSKGGEMVPQATRSLTTPEQTGPPMSDGARARGADGALKNLCGTPGFGELRIVKKGDQA